MDKVELQREITRLERKLEQYKQQQRKSKEDSQKLNEYARIASQKKAKVEGAFNSMLRNAKSRSSQLSPNNKYREKYNAKMQSIFKGKNAVGAVDSLQKICTKARAGINSKDSEHNEIVRKINNTQSRIDELKEQLKNELSKGDK